MENSKDDYIYKVIYCFKIYNLSWKSLHLSLTILKANFALNFSGVAISTPFEINRKICTLI